MFTGYSVTVSTVSAVAGSVVTVSTVDSVSVEVDGYDVVAAVSDDTVSVVTARPAWLARCLICFS